LGRSFKPQRKSNFVPDFRNDLKDEDDDDWFKPPVGKVVPTISRRLGGTESHSQQQ
jgi:hypothetical protein